MKIITWYVTLHDSYGGVESLHNPHHTVLALNIELNKISTEIYIKKNSKLFFIQKEANQKKVKVNACV